MSSVAQYIDIRNHITFSNFVANLHKNSIYKPVEIKNQIPFPRVFAKMRI